ncbi:UbiX family flavin prenyltransferase [Mesorhizobium sp. B1-1-4]|uniref:UbiX family flavin prenyltransferase n=1 Tax=unclassified Mesorhizobium TaxID=325217 RepID=UPI00112C2E06|nr:MULTISPECIES: UbiX family flavin prenyltransferase [unclassified Mesorhizobium]MBZ9918021.1 UbiX family flavin prenyltransferase [Mesorhizobium sp. BR1-1-7]MBZ9956227.1 UbiX family flavin prenyltransferase [Mesorhizobium sp. BR1-1-15]MBZ9973205.1 UbiX family flavin prenyltransferase [Mesorhizobium sp. BR1-1-12]TPN45249.1 UbiX family flavin prenyltransferase [Mesorhizobium sp. B1-1-4]
MSGSASLWQGGGGGPQPLRIIVGISGASGAVYGVRALDQLRAAGIETHLIVTRSAHLTLSQELGMRPAEIAERASVFHNVQNIGASISSGSFRTLGMLIAPCSVRTMSEIASGVTSSLMSRAADVVLKERRKLVLMLRETPLHLGHLRTMTALAEIGAILMPPVPAFYAKPRSLEEMVDHSVGRALDLFGIDSGKVGRWEGMSVDREACPKPADDAS